MLVYLNILVTLSLLVPKMEADNLVKENRELCVINKVIFCLSHVLILMIFKNMLLRKYNTVIL